jgi:hypothetical protein
VDTVFLLIDAVAESEVDFGALNRVLVEAVAVARLGAVDPPLAIDRPLA